MDAAATTVAGLADPLVNATLDPGVFLVEYFLAGTTRSGQPYRVLFAAVVRAGNGLFSSFRDYTDMLAAASVRGVVDEVVAGAQAAAG